MIKRLFDIIFSSLGLVVLAPLLLLIALIIKIESKGPVFYRQVRVGKDDLDFRIFKFRTMYVGSDAKGLLTLGDKDSRVTRVGFYLRKYKLDELPQLINVFNGSMSFVGPRPEVRKYVDHYTEDDMLIFKIKPGITDFASIAFRHEAELLKANDNPELLYIQEIMPKKLALNKKYMEHNSLAIDIKIILQTFISIIR